MIKATKIEIPFMEGKISWSNKTFVSRPDSSCWEQFQKYVRSIAREYQNELNKRKAEWLGYLKTDFIVTFEDGEIYQGRYDLVASGKDDSSDTLPNHIRRFCEVYSGLRKPAHFKDIEWEQFKKEYADPKRGEFLNKYDLPQLNYY